MIVVAAPSDFGSFTVAFERLEGILLGLAASIIVASLWPRFPVAGKKPQTPPPPVPAVVGELDV
jgi:hypothetical protein